ncbi:nucleotidyltransferase domain-containing protein [Sulfobacillus thermosulfidooxidans]|uniref:nucleotidyltransferase domain-containing protein n=1 Tax=Sulfobacillus thermosulfidooxidans TaxID=28034 RepID=UPI0006B6461B|nr:nucleotidyltransferase domain-containing protein [Sulfobacillus thermosulfidooxidans]
MNSVPDTVVHNIVTHFPEVNRIILFGSRARGDARPDSDWDFLVIMPSDKPPTQRGIAVRRVARIRGISMDILVKTPEEVAEGFPMMADDIIREGQVIYERSR